jgi:hypothetical protein
MFLSLLISKKKKILVIIPFLITFIAAGFSESFALAALVLMVFVLMIIVVINPKDKNEKLKIAIAGLAGITVSLIIMSLAPGNDARALTVTKPESLMFVVKSTVLTTKWYLLRFFSIKTFLCSLGILTVSTFFFSKKYNFNNKVAFILMGGSIITAVLITAVVIGAGYYSMSIIPPERTLFIVIYMILLCFFVFAFCLSGILQSYLSVDAKKKILWVVILINFVFSSLVTLSMIKHWSNIRTEIVTYANTWDKEVNNLPVIKNIKAVGELDNFTDNKGWVASCLAGYYSLESVTVQVNDD